MSMPKWNADRRMQATAVRNLCLKAASGLEREPESLQDFYRDASACHPGQEVAFLSLPEPDTYRHMVAPPHTAFRDLTPWDGGLFGVEVYGTKLSAVSMERGLSTAPVGFEVSALTDIPRGFAVLSTSMQQIVLLDAGLKPTFRRNAGELGVTLKQGSRIAHTGDRLAVVLPDARKVLILTDDLVVAAEVRLPCASLAHDIVGYAGGVLLSEGVPASNRGGGLLWVGPDGGIRSLGVGLDRPMGLSVQPQGVVVCDFAGVHFVTLDGLAVAGHACLRWEDAAGSAGERSGYCYETIIEDGEMTTILRLASGGIARNTNFRLLRHAVPQGAWAGGQPAGESHGG